MAEPAQPGNSGQLAGGAALLGFVLGLTLLSWLVAAGNFQVVDPEHDPTLEQIFGAIEGDEARTMALRYVAGESNRAMFRLLAPLQLVGCLLGTWCLGRALRGQKGRAAQIIRFSLPLLLLCAVVVALLVPTIIEQGRSLDFVSRQGGDPPLVVEFKRLHILYMSADLVKVLVATVLIVLAWRSARGPDPQAVGAVPQSPEIQNPENQSPEKE